MSRVGVLVLIFVLAFSGAVWAQDFQQDVLASRDVQRRMAEEFREMWLVMGYRQKEALVIGYCLAVGTEHWIDAYMSLGLELEKRVDEIIGAKTPRLKSTVEEVIRWTDFYYEKEREEYADLGAVLWWFLHGNERPLGDEDVIREWEKRTDERIYERARERRR